MKIVINATPLLSFATGVGRYTYEISKYLEQDKQLKVDFFYGYYSKKLIEPDEKTVLKSFKSSIRSKYIKKILRKLLAIFSKIRISKYDVYWEPNFIPIRHINTNKIISSIHDFSFILYKDFHPRERIEYFDNYFFKNIYKSDMIICFSEFTKREIMERLNFEDNRIKVIPHGVKHDVFRVHNDLSLGFVLPQKFILCVGSIEPRKNLLGLLKAYDKLSSEIKSEYKLVLAGFKGWKNKDIMKIIDDNKEYVIYLGYISDLELAKVYNLASLFVFPSFYEGFGFPPLEAMACGTPVITSNVSSLPEVGGDAVIYCNPYDIEDIKEKIEMVLNNKELQRKMIEKGLKRVKQFTWEKAAKKHLEVFNKVLKN